MIRPVRPVYSRIVFNSDSFHESICAPDKRGYSSKKAGISWYESTISKTRRTTSRKLLRFPYWNLF